MPKHTLAPLPRPDGGSGDRRIEMQWQRDQYVQIATTVWAGEPGTEPDPFLEFLPTPATTTNDLPRAWAGQFVDLNRDQINHLIKQLRAARDQAFGKDE